MEHSELMAEVYERKDEPGAWAVEASDMAGDGQVYLTVFYGPDAHQRASEYAAAKYGNSRLAA